MSTQISPAPNDLDPQVYRKPRADVYTILLVVALIAIIIATSALWLVMKEYEYKINGGPEATQYRPAIGTSIDAKWLNA